VIARPTCNAEKPEFGSETAWVVPSKLTTPDDDRAGLKRLGNTGLGDALDDPFGLQPRGHGAIYTEHGKFLHIIRKVFVRVSAKLDWFVAKLH